MPKFSIIVPVYNVEKYINKCIDSLISQTLKDIEIILVDDGTPDKSGEICDEYAKKDDRIKVIHKKNEGVSAARNDGLAAATGEWVIFCDSDDWMEQNACELMYLNGEKVGASVVIADIFQVIGINKKYCRIFNNEFIIDNLKDKEHLLASVYYQNCSCLTPKKHMVGYGGPWNKAVKRSLLINNDIKFDPIFKGDFDDRYFALNIYLSADKILYIQKPVYNYVFVAESITKSYKAAMREINNSIFDKFFAFADKNDLTGVLKNAYYSMTIFRLSISLELYYFNKNNVHSLRNNLHTLKEDLHNKNYSIALKNVNVSKLSPYNKCVAVLGRLYCVLGLYLLNSIKNNIKNN